MRRMWHRVGSWRNRRSPNPRSTQRICSRGLAAALALVTGTNVWAQLPAHYDLRAVGSGSATVAWVPDIQDQGIFDDCWTFAGATAIESSMLKSGLFGNAPAAPPAIRVSSWHLSTRNGAAESIVPVADYGNNTYDYGWGGFEYQTMGYLTRGQGSWTIPDVPSTAPENYISTMGGGAVFVSGSVNAFPSQLVTSTPPNLGNLLPVANQTPAVQTRQVVFLAQGFSNNVGLPPPIHPNGSTYDFNLGAADPQVQAVKGAILQYGAVTTGMKADYDLFHYVSTSGTAKYEVQYFNPGKNPNDATHEVTIIGWDDTKQITTSATTTTGAWLVQNSWGRSNWTDPNVAYANDGTFWAPFDDAVIARNDVAAFVIGPTDGYGPKVIQNELGPIGYAFDFNDASAVLGMAPDVHTTVASILTPTELAQLVALGVTTGVAGTTLQIDIFADWSGTGPVGAPLLQQSLTLGGIGYQLVDLALPLALSAGDSIVVQLTYGSSNAAQVVVGNSGLAPVITGTDGRISYPVTAGLSYYQQGDGTWVDFATKSFAADPQSTSADTRGGVLFLKGIVAPVPEPTTLVLAALGGALVGWRALSSRRRMPPPA